MPRRPTDTLGEQPTVPRASALRYRPAGLRWRHPLGKVYNGIDGQSGQRVDLTVLHRAKGLTNAHVDACLAAARVLEGLDEPGIQKITDAFATPDGSLTVVCKHVDGTVLAQQVARRALPVSRFVVIMRQLCQLLGRAHSAGITHGALSVGSVILSGRAGHPDSVTLTDFGLQGVVAADLQIPQEDAALQPVSPERALGLSRGRKEDIYLLGCLGYAMLTGGGLFRTGDAEAVVRRHAIEDPMPIGQRLKARRLPPKAITDIVHRCLSKEVDDRFADLADLDAELCLAQIQARIRTPWDAELPLPDVDDARRTRIARGLRPETAKGLPEPAAPTTEVDPAESRPIDVDKLYPGGLPGTPTKMPSSPTAPITRRKPLPLRNVEAMHARGEKPRSRVASDDQLTAPYPRVGGAASPAPGLPQDFPLRETTPVDDDDELDAAAEDDGLPSMQAGIPPPPQFTAPSPDAGGAPPMVADANAVPRRGRSPVPSGRPIGAARGADRPPLTSGEIGSERPQGEQAKPPVGRHPVGHAARDEPTASIAPSFEGVQQPVTPADVPAETSAGQDAAHDPDPVIEPGLPSQPVADIPDHPPSTGAPSEPLVAVPDVPAQVEHYGTVPDDEDDDEGDLETAIRQAPSPETAASAVQTGETIASPAEPAELGRPSPPPPAAPVQAASAPSEHTAPTAQPAAEPSTEAARARQPAAAPSPFAPPPQPVAAPPPAAPAPQSATAPPPAAPAPQSDAAPPPAAPAPQSDAAPSPFAPAAPPAAASAPSPAPASSAPAADSPLEQRYRPIIPTAAQPTVAAAMGTAPADDGSPLEAGFRQIVPTAAYQSLGMAQQARSPAPAAPSPSPLGAPASSPGPGFGTPAASPGPGFGTPAASPGPGFGSSFPAPGSYTDFDDDFDLPKRNLGMYVLLLVLGLAAGLGVAYAVGGLDPVLDPSLRRHKPEPKPQPAEQPQPVQVIKAPEPEPEAPDFE